MAETKSVGTSIGGAPVSWVALMGALLGGGSIIPLVYYVEGGGFHSLSYTLMALVACILGPWGGGAAATIGWFINLFLSPAGSIGQIFDWTGTAVMAGLIVQKRWKWIWWVPLLGIIIYEITPWYWPGVVGGPESLPQPFLAFSVWYDALSLPLLLTVGRHTIADWIKSNDNKKMFFGLMLLHWTAAEAMHMYGWGIWTGLYYPIPAYVVAVLEATSVPFERVILQVVSGIVGVPLLVSLRKSGLRKIPGAVW